MIELFSYLINYIKNLFIERKINCEEITNYDEIDICELTKYYKRNKEIEYDFFEEKSLSINKCIKLLLKDINDNNCKILICNILLHYINNNKINKTEPKKIPSSIRKQVWLKYFGNCFYNKCQVKWCTNDIDYNNFECDHKFAKSIGGPTLIFNLIPICSSCNKSKGNKYTFDEWNNKFILNQ